jgi:hypothetical protein
LILTVICLSLPACSTITNCRHAELAKHLARSEHALLNK